METGHYHCSAEWHFARLAGQGAYTAALIYSHSLRLSKKSNVYSASVPRLAAYFSVDERTVRKAIRALVALGFFEILRAEAGCSINYKPIHHRDWCVKHPGRCTEKLEMPWANEQQDTLGPELHAISGHRFMVFPNFLKGMRKTGHDDAAVREHFRAFVQQELPSGKQWRNGFAGHFIQYLKKQPVSCNNPSQPL